jgi:hypothetical protein
MLKKRKRQESTARKAVGPRALRLPSPRPVWDLLSGAKLGDAVTRIDMTVTPPETRLFYFGGDDPMKREER